ncbi:MAG: NUDIX hydrolase [Bacillota bacterium]
MTVTRDFTIAVFVVDRDRVLLLWHNKLQRWLPPGGHSEPNELPDEAAVREVWEETGLEVALVGETGPNDGVRHLVRPAGIQLEEIIAGEHQHIDLVYLAVPVGSRDLVGNGEGSRLGWYSASEAVELGLTEEIANWVDRALRVLGTKNVHRSAGTDKAGE